MGTDRGAPSRSASVGVARKCCNCASEWRYSASGAADGNRFRHCYAACGCTAAKDNVASARNQAAAGIEQSSSTSAAKPGV